MGLPKIASYVIPTLEELPVARVQWQLQPERAALLVHDMQGYFVGAYETDGSLISTVIKNIEQLISASRSAGIPIFYTAQNGDQKREDRGLQADFWGPGMSGHADHQAIIEALAPRENDNVLTKHRYSAFQKSDLEVHLQKLNRNQLIICGIYAHIGCLLTAADAFMRDIEPFFVADAVGDFSRADHDSALSYVAGCCGLPVMSEEIIGILQRSEPCKP